jgi:membrane protease YdiL (CAAX protease family)
LYHAALATTGACILAIYAVQGGLVVLGVAPLAAVAASLGTAIALVLLAERRRPGLAGLRLARPRFFLAALLIGGSLWFVSLVLVEWLLPEQQLPQLERLVDTSGFAPTFVIVAILPALAEELVFRGVLARALARRFGPVIGIGASAALFAVYHLEPAQMIPTFLLGVAFAFVAVRADSALPTMLGHAANNAIVVALSRAPDGAVAQWLSDHPGTSLAVCALLTVSGLAVSIAT